MVWTHLPRFCLSRQAYCLQFRPNKHSHSHSYAQQCFGNWEKDGLMGESSEVSALVYTLTKCVLSG